MNKVSTPLTKQLHTCYPREQASKNLTYLFQLIPTQTWHVNGALSTLKCNQNTLPSKMLYQGDIESYRKDSDVPFAKAFQALCVITNVATTG